MLKHATKNIAVHYRDGVWIDVVDGRCIPRSIAFCYYGYDLANLRSWFAERMSGSLDYWTFAYSPKFGDTIVDVGAGRGIDALALNGTVRVSALYYAIEAHPKTFHFYLLTTCALNDLHNVKCYNLAAGRRGSWNTLDGQPGR